MGDTRSGYDEDSLPWLQEVEDEDSRGGISARAMLAGLVVVALLGAALWAGFFWLGRSSGGEGGGAPELIRAPAEPYKVKPQDPGGLDITGSQTTFETSAGEDVDSRLNTEAPDAPRPPTEPPPASEPKRIPPNETKVPATPDRPPPQLAGAAGSVIQLGAFRNTAQAERAWTALSARFPMLSSMTKIVVPYSAAGSSGFRLRAAAASPEAARQACASIQAGGESCFLAR